VPNAFSNGISMKFYVPSAALLHWGQHVKLKRDRKEYLVLLPTELNWNIGRVYLQRETEIFYCRNKIYCRWYSAT
jgi:hypothetical protein